MVADGRKEPEKNNQLYKEGEVMNFFDTVAGQRFTQETIPSLIKELEKINNRKQYFAIYGGSNNIQIAIQAELDKGARIVSMANTKEKLIVVYEK